MQVTFKNQNQETLNGTLFGKNNRKGAIIFTHGFPSDSNKFSIKLLLFLLSLKGYKTLAFDFAGSGRSEGDFSKTSFFKQAKDIQASRDYLNHPNTILIGHSGGAIASTIYASQTKNPLNKLILLSMPNSCKEIEEFTKEQKQSFKQNGYITYNAKGQSHHKKRLNKTFYNEFNKLKLETYLKKVSKQTKLLLIHGSKDTLVPVKHATELINSSNTKKSNNKSNIKLKIIKGADHIYSNPLHTIKLSRLISKSL